MENKNIQLLKREFKFSSQAYTLVKTLVFIYGFKKTNINYPLFVEGENKVADYLKELCDLANHNILQIDEVCGNEFGDIFRDCIVSYDFYAPSKSFMAVALTTVNDFSIEDIENFIVNDATFVGGREDFSSPKNLIDIVIGLLSKNTNQTWFDLGCGNGDFLVEVAKNKNNYLCYGEDINYNCQLLTKIRMHFTGTNARIKENNILTSKYGEFVDVAYANTPFLMRLSKGDYNYNIYNKYVGSLKPSQNADWIFADRLLQAIKDRGIILMTEASLMNYVDIEQRKSVIEQNLVEGVIKLPANIFMYTGISVSMVIFNKNKKDNEIKFLDATKMCTTGRRLSELNVSEILRAYNSDNAVIKVNIDSISKDDYSLHVKRYLDVNDIILEDETLLENVVHEIFRGAQIPASMIDEYSKVATSEKVYKLISVGDIQNGSFDSENLQVIKNDGKFDRYLVKNGDVLVSSKSTKIKTAIVEIAEDESIVATGSLLVIRCDQNKINSVFLKTFFDSSNGSKLLESIQTGTSIISINASALMKMRISCINRTKQDEIAEKFLLKLDQFKITQSKLIRLEKEMNSIFDDSIGG